MAYRVLCFRAACLATVVIGALTSGQPQAQHATPAAADFYRGKTVNVLVGFSVGGGFDLYGRALARHLGRHIPGNPTVVVQNMPGAGSLKSVDYLFSVAPRDGTLIGTFSHTIPIEPLIGNARFDPRQLAWIGSMASETSVCLAWGRSPVKTWDDLRRLPFTIGGTGRGSDTDMYAKLLRSVFGLPVKLVTGYPGTSEMVLATERGELDGFCGIFYSTLVTRHDDWIAGGRINILVQAGLTRDKELPNVPMVLDFARDDRERQILMLLIAPQTMARPFAMPPGTPSPRVEVMRRAFHATLADPEFLADAAAARIDISAVSAGEIERLLAALYRTPPDIVQQAVRALAE